VPGRSPGARYRTARFFPAALPQRPCPLSGSTLEPVHPSRTSTWPLASHSPLPLLHVGRCGRVCRNRSPSNIQRST